MSNHTHTAADSRWAPAALLLGAWVALCGCGTAPAHPHPSRAYGPALPLNGEYDVTLHTPWVGPILTHFTAAPTKDGFKANTRPGVAWSMIGGFEGLIGPLVMPFLFPSGMILTWNSTLPTADKPGEGTVGIGQLASFRVRTRMTGPDRPVEVLLKDGRTVALLTLEAHAGGGPVTDYNDLASRAAGAIKSNLYDPELAASPQVRGYCQDLTSGAAKATDDLEFLFATAMAGRAHSKYVQPLIYRRPDGSAEAALFKDYTAVATAQRTSFDEKTHIATLHIDTFLHARDVDRAFEEILARNPRAIILDLHTCMGVEVASLRAAAWLIEKPETVGVFFGRAQRADVLHGRPFDAPSVTVCDADSLAALQHVLDTGGAARVTVTPDPRRFAGPVAVITSARTSYSAEPLVWLLKQSGRTKVYGETTAGRPFLSREVDVGQGWVLRISSQDFAPPAGDRITGRGVRPDFKVEKGAAAERAAADLLRAAVESATP